MLRTGGGGGVFADGPPEDVVQLVVVVLVGLVEIHVVRIARRGRSGGGIAFVKGDARLLGGVRAPGRASVWNTAVMGRAPASKWVMGCKPRRNSMVRSMEVVLYMVLSTAWRFT